MCDDDDDNDGLTDIYETTVTGTDPFNADTGNTGVPDGMRDPDFDGLNNLEEQDLGTDPTSPEHTFARGLNLFTYPIETTAGFSAFDFLSDLGGSSVVECIQKYDPAIGVYQEARYSGATPTGTDFNIAGGDGLLVTMKSQVLLGFTGTPFSSQGDLHNGPNLRVFNAADFGSTAYDIFPELAVEGTVTSLQKYLPSEGRFVTVSTYQGDMVGPDFPITSGETYLVHMIEVSPMLLVTFPSPNQLVTTTPITVHRSGRRRRHFGHREWRECNGSRGHFLRRRGGARDGHQ